MKRTRPSPGLLSFTWLNFGHSGCCWDNRVGLGGEFENAGHVQQSNKVKGPNTVSYIRNTYERGKHLSCVSHWSAGFPVTCSLINTYTERRD